jgi:hypothetical protein
MCPGLICPCAANTPHPQRQFDDHSVGWSLGGKCRRHLFIWGRGCAARGDARFTSDGMVVCSSPTSQKHRHQAPGITGRYMPHGGAPRPGQPLALAVRVLSRVATAAQWAPQKASGELELAFAGPAVRAGAGPKSGDQSQAEVEVFGAWCVCAWCV